MKLGLVALFVTMPVLLASGVWKTKQEVQFEQMNSAVFHESSQFATEAVGAIRTVHSLTMESSINNKYKELLDGHVDAEVRKGLWTAALFWLRRERNSRLPGGNLLVRRTAAALPNRRVRSARLSLSA